jgi:prepilin signal peptidase PulO-like enzyme (type II secretory pathway)
MRLTRIRLGELLALAGAVCLVVALTLPWYENANGKLGAWSTFGPAVALLIAAAIAALALVLSAVTERTPALPVATAVWGVPFGLVAVIAASVRLLERPQHATSLCAGAWLALAGAVAVLLGAWHTLRDERTSRYGPAAPEARRLPE